MAAATLAVPTNPGEILLTALALGELDTEGLLVGDDERLSRDDIDVNAETEALREKAALAESDIVTEFTGETVAVAEGETDAELEPVGDGDADVETVCEMAPVAVSVSVI